MISRELFSSLEKLNLEEVNFLHRKKFAATCKPALLRYTPPDTQNLIHPKLQLLLQPREPDLGLLPAIYSSLCVQRYADWDYNMFSILLGFLWDDHEPEELELHLNSDTNLERKIIVHRDTTVEVIINCVSF